MCNFQAFHSLMCSSNDLHLTVISIRHLFLVPISPNSDLADEDESCLMTLYMGL